MTENYLEGKIIKVYRNTTKNGKPYRALEIETGDTLTRYGLWDNDLAPELGEGDKVKYAWEQKGNYKNVIDLEVISQEANGDYEPYVEPGNQASYSDKDLMIGRSVALKASVRLLQEQDMDLEEKIRKTIDIADQLMLYLVRGNNFPRGEWPGTRDDLPF